MESREFKDNFSQQSQDYALFRPHYPDVLGKILAELAPSTKVALMLAVAQDSFQRFWHIILIR